MTSSCGSGVLISFVPLRDLMFKNLQNVGVRPEKVGHYTYIIKESDESALTEIFIQAHSGGRQIMYIEDLVACLKDAGSDAEAEKVMKCYANSL